VGSIPTSRPNSESIIYETCHFPVCNKCHDGAQFRGKTMALQLYGRHRKECDAGRPQDSNRFPIPEAKSTSGSDPSLNERLRDVTSFHRFQPLSSYGGPCQRKVGAMRDSTTLHPFRY
jgi:hypothetical protein